jgi:hypothetical protein
MDIVVSRWLADENLKLHQDYLLTMVIGASFRFCEIYIHKTTIK